uniref:RING-type domain-containing protein n=1 Tax=Caenorhabditis japonica TaxID=281687 RepID=A0A8R1DFJ0_CAEJA
MDWVHCNYCGTKPTQIKMFLTFCGHVFCQNCVAKAKSRQNCHVCQKPLKTAEINKNMSPECMDFFKDVRQIATEAVAELKHVVKFQQAQREFFWKVKYSQAKRETEMFNEARNKHQKALQEVEYVIFFCFLSTRNVRSAGHATRAKNSWQRAKICEAQSQR